MHPYVSSVVEKITQSIETQEETLQEVSYLLANRVENEGILHVLGSGHSHMIAEEIFYRAGGPLFVNPILEPGLMLHNGPIKSTRIERLPGYANAVLKDIEFNENDAFLIISNSGRNVLPIETALFARDRNLLTLSITSLAHSKSVESRHSSGKRLFEITDYVLDNYGEVGDASIHMKNPSISYGPTSSAVGIVLVQTLISMVIESLVEKGIQPPLLQSANLDHTDSKNEKVVQKYIDRIPLLR